MPSDNEKTICAKCRHHRGTGDIWYNHLCECPAHEREKTLDVVTGKMGYVGGRYPHCRDVNTGACKAWEPR